MSFSTGCKPVFMSCSSILRSLDPHSICKLCRGSVRQFEWDYALSRSGDVRRRQLHCFSGSLGRGLVFSNHSPST